MDWNYKFSSLVKETESNLAKVKERLQPSSHNNFNTSAVESNAKSNNLSSIHGTNASKYDHSSSPILPYTSPLTKFSLNNYSSFHSSLENNNHGDYDIGKSSGVIALLNDKIDAQSKIIETLLNTVKKLEEERNFYSHQVKDFRDDITQLNRRIAEKGIDLQTENKIEQWKQEVRSQMTEMRSQLEAIQSSNDMRYRQSLSNHDCRGVVQDLRNFRSFMSTECDGLRYSIENVKKRLNKVESGIQLSSNITGPSPSISNSMQQHLGNYSNRNVIKPTSFTADSAGLAQLRNNIDTIRHQLCGMETEIKKSNPLLQPYQSNNTKNQVQRSFDTRNDYNISPEFSDEEPIAITKRQFEVGSTLPKHQELSWRAKYRSDSPLADVSLDLEEVDDHSDLSLDLEENDIKTEDLEDVKTANTVDLELSYNADDDFGNDHELSIDDLT